MANFPASLLILNGKSADNQPLREAITLLRDEGIQIHGSGNLGKKATRSVTLMKPVDWALKR